MLNGKGGDKVALYNLKGDLAETTNLADQHPDKVKQMQSVLKDWQADIDATTTPQP